MQTTVLQLRVRVRANPNPNPKVLQNDHVLYSAHLQVESESCE